MQKLKISLALYLMLTIIDFIAFTSLGENFIQNAKAIRGRDGIIPPEQVDGAVVKLLSASKYT